MKTRTIKNSILVCQPNNEDGFYLNDRLWTKSSPEFSNWQACVEFCSNRNMLLQTLDDAVEFRYKTNGADNSNYYQVTSTLIAMALDEVAGIRAYIFEPDQEEIRILLKRQEIIQNKSHISLDISEDLGQRVKRFANKTGRTFIMPDEDLQLDIKPNESGQSSYGTSVYVAALLPKYAEQNAKYILAYQAEQNSISMFIYQEKVYPDNQALGCVCFARPKLEHGQMILLPVGLGGEDDLINYIFADDSFYLWGLARGHDANPPNLFK